jgi:predicted DNA-binding protein YlxM (UPF0122 family)
LQHLKRVEIELLHQYNDIKDVCQTLMSALARCKDMSLEEIATAFDVSD